MKIFINLFFFWGDRVDLVCCVILRVGFNVFSFFIDLLNLIVRKFIINNGLEGVGLVYF